MWNGEEELSRWCADGPQVPVYQARDADHVSTQRAAAASFVVDDEYRRQDVSQRDNASVR